MAIFNSFLYVYQAGYLPQPLGPCQVYGMSLRQVRRRLHHILNGHPVPWGKLKKCDKPRPGQFMNIGFEKDLQVYIYNYIYILYIYP